MTGRPPRLRRPAHGERVQYPTVRDHAPIALTRTGAPMPKASSDLHDSPSLLLCLHQRPEVVQGSDRRLLQIDIGARGKGDCGQSEVLTERRGNHDDVYRSHGSQRIA